MDVGAVRVLVADRQPLFSRGLELLLPAASGERVRVVASTSTADLVPRLAQRHRPDLVLVDLGLSPPGGLWAIRAVRRVDPHPAVVGTTSAIIEEPELCLAVDALAAGARSLLVKPAEPEALVVPLLAAAAGWAVVPHRIQRLLTRGVAARPPRPRLGAAEHRLWTLIAQGASTVRIAAELHVSERTVKRLTAALLLRLGVGSRTEAATLAGRCGLLDGLA